MNNSGYEFRIATLDDLDSLVTLWCESSSYHEEIENRFKYASDAADWTKKYFSDQLPKDEFTIFVASDDGSIFGFIEAQLMEKGPIHAQRRIGYIGSLYVRPQYRRKGVGSHLWSLAHDWLEAQDISKIQLAVAVKNPSGFEFWKQIGFQELMFQMQREID